MIDDEETFFEEYGEEMIKSFLSFGIHFKEYVCEMNKQLCDDAVEYAHKFAEEYNIKVTFKDDEYYYEAIDKSNSKDDFVYGIISIYMKFTDHVKEKDADLWERAIHYSSDYGGVGRIKFFHVKDDEDGTRKD